VSTDSPNPSDAELILCPTTPAFAQQDIAKACLAPHLTWEGGVPAAATFGSMTSHSRCERAGNRAALKKKRLAETGTLPC